MQRKLLSVFGALAATALAVGVSPAEADIIFGSLTPSPACGAVSGVGAVCGINETFTSGGDTVVAHGFTGAPGADGGNVNLTLKPMPLNVLGESGLGVQANNTATTCTDPECEIVPPQSVSATRSGSTLITDALIVRILCPNHRGRGLQSARWGDHEHLQLPGRLGGGNGPVPVGCASRPDAVWRRGASRYGR